MPRAQPREFMMNGRKVELIGRCDKVGVWIDDVRHVGYSYYWRSLRAARMSARAYCQRHPVITTEEPK